MLSSSALLSLSALALMFLLSCNCVPVTARYIWHGLPQYDSENFFCKKYDELCHNLLEEIGCKELSIQGCPNDDLALLDTATIPAISANTMKCECTAPFAYKAGTIRIAQEIIINRVQPDIFWQLEPFSSGPPYDMRVSFEKACKLTLDRIGCNHADQLISPNVSTGAFDCKCGVFTATSNILNYMMIDKMNDVKLKQMPIFSNPIYLSVPLSLCLVLIIGKLGAVVAVYLKLPPIIGFLLMGLAIQNFISPMVLKGVGYPFPSANSELKLLALIIVLMRAGLAVKFEDIKKNSVAVISLSSIPYFCEFFTFMFVGKAVLGWSTIDMGLFASMMSAIGPSVVISGLMLLIGSTKHTFGFTPNLGVVTTPLEAVVAIILFGIFSLLEQSSGNPLYPWVKAQPLYVNCLLIPVNILLSIVLGVICGYGVSKYINARIKKPSDFIWVRIGKNPQMGGSTADLIFVFLVLCYTMMSLCTLQYIQQTSGVLVVFTIAVSVSKFVDGKVAQDIAQGLKGIWVFAEVFLFTFTGCSLTFDHDNGPLYGQRGPGASFLSQIVGVMFAGMGARMIGVFVTSFLIIRPTFPEHRKDWKWLSMFSLNMFIFQIPKATVQATLGAVAYNTALIPGATGQNKGLLIAQASAFTILVFAPIGTILTKFVGEKLARRLTEIDLEHKWSDAENRYLNDSEFVKEIEDQVQQLDEKDATLKKFESVESKSDPLEEAAKGLVRRFSKASVPPPSDLNNENNDEGDATPSQNMVRRYSKLNSNPPPADGTSTAAVSIEMVNTSANANSGGV